MKHLFKKKQKQTKLLFTAIFTKILANTSETAESNVLKHLVQSQI